MVPVLWQIALQTFCSIVEWQIWWANTFLNVAVPYKVWCACLNCWSSWSCWSCWNSTIVYLQLASVTFCFPFEWSNTSNTLSIDFIRCWLWTFAFLSVFVPDVSFFTSQLTGSFNRVPNEWLQTFNALTSQIDWECLRTDAFVLRIAPDVIRNTFTGWLGCLKFFTFVSNGVMFGSVWTGDASFFVKIEDRSWIIALDTFWFGACQKRGLKRTFGDVIIGDKVEEIFIVVIDGLIADDPIGSIEIGDIFEIGVRIGDSPGGGTSPSSCLLSKEMKLPYGSERKWRQ